MAPRFPAVAMVCVTMLCYLLMLLLNELVFTRSEFSTGMNWVYLPAGVRLLSTLLFGAAGAVGIFLASLAASAYYYFPDDSIKALAGAISSSLAPYLIYRFAAYRFKFHDGSLANLTPARLLLCSVLYAIANAALLNLWHIPLVQPPNPVQGIIVVFVGDLLGTLIVLYSIKFITSVFTRCRQAG